MDTTNYGLLNNMASGIRETMNTYMTLKNQKRQQQLLELQGGIQQDDQGNYQFTPEQQQKRDLQTGMLKNQATVAQHQANEYDPTSEESSTAGGLLSANGIKGIDGQSAHTLKEFGPIIESKYKADASGAGLQDRAFGRAFNQHKAAVDSVQNDKQVQQLLGGYQSIQNALTNFKASGGMPQEFSQLQTSLRLNAGQGGARTGVHERAEGYAKDYGIPVSEVEQFLSGNIQDVSKMSPNLTNAVADIAEAELNNKRQQASARIKQKSGSLATLYRSSPLAAQFKPDFDSTVNDMYSQFNMDPTGKYVAPADSSPAHSPPKARDEAAQQPAPGLLSRIGNMFGIGTADAMTAQPQTQAPSQSALPKEGDVKSYGGKTYKVIKGHWVEQ